MVSPFLTLLIKKESESITKKKLTVTLDETILEKAKKHIQNLSEFFENCLKQYMGFKEGLIPIADTKEILDKIGMLQVEYYIANENIDIKKNLEKQERLKYNQIWRQLYRYYCETYMIDDNLMKKAMNLFDLDYKTIEAVLDYAFVVDADLDSEWFNIYNKYKKEGINL